MIVSQCSQPPVDGVSNGRADRDCGRTRPGARSPAAMPRIQATGETPPVEPRGAVTPPPTLAPRRRAMDRRVGGIQQLGARRCAASWAAASGAGSARSRRATASPTDSASRQRDAKRGERRPGRRRPTGSATAVRPARRAVERHDRRDPVLAEPFEDRVRAPPAPLPAHLLDLVPVDREADELDADPVELCDPLVERAAARRRARRRPGARSGRTGRLRPAERSRAGQRARRRG